MQVVLVVGITWIGVAAKQGPSHVAFWVMGILLYYLPLMGVIVYLSRLMPLEGGVYQWAKLGLGPFFGFLTAWNLFAFTLVIFGGSGIVVAASLAYALGPPAAWMASSGWLITLLNTAVFGLVVWVNIRGFHVGKWISNAAGAMTVGIFAALILLLLVRPGHPQPGAGAAFSLAAPAVTLFSVNLFSKIAFSALGGLEQVAVFAGESKNPGRSIARSVWLAAPLIAALYILGTGAVLAYIPPGKVDLTAPIPQTLSAALGTHRTLAWIGGLAIACLTAGYIGQTIVCVAEAARLPMVAGWDGLIPAWFTELHPRYRTPWRSIWFVVLCCLAFGLFSLLGAGQQEAYQILQGTSCGCLGIYYLVLFAIPLCGTRNFSSQPSIALRVAATSGMAVTILATVLQMFPIVDVARPFVFGAKVALTVALLNAAAVALYLRGRRAGERREAVSTR